MTSWLNCERMLSIDSTDTCHGPGRQPMNAGHPYKETAMSIILSAILLICYAGLLAIALILAASVDNDDQE